MLYAIMPASRALRRPVGLLLLSAAALLPLASCAGCAPYHASFPEEWRELPAARFPASEDREPRRVGWSVPSYAPTYFGGRDIIELRDDVERMVARLLREEVASSMEWTDWWDDEAPPVALEPAEMTLQLQCAADAILAHRLEGGLPLRAHRAFEDVILGRCGLPSSAVVRGRSPTLYSLHIATAGLTEMTARALSTAVVDSAWFSYANLRSRFDPERRRLEGQEAPFDWAVAWNRRLEGTTFVVDLVAVALPLRADVIAVEPFAMHSDDGRFVIEGPHPRGITHTRVYLYALSGGPGVTCARDFGYDRPERLRFVCALPEGVDLGVVSIEHERLKWQHGGSRQSFETGNVPIARHGPPPLHWSVSPPDVPRPDAEDPAERALVWLNALLEREDEAPIPWVPSLEQLARMVPPEVTDEPPPNIFIGGRWRAPEARSVSARGLNYAHFMEADPWEAAAAIRFSSTFALMHRGRAPLTAIAFVEAADCIAPTTHCAINFYMFNRRMDVEDPADVAEAIREQIDTWRDLLDLLPAQRASAGTQQQLDEELHRIVNPEHPRQRRFSRTFTGPIRRVGPTPGVHPEYWIWKIAGPTDLVLPPTFIDPTPPSIAISTLRECNPNTNACHDLVLIGVEDVGQLVRRIP
ncbi:MAG: hypothetical protein EA398_15770 [Deltaproteobacteria bacterium]|nr:MAG: hypothetical protein EA398_15770 [Deltaproteobacteria bacterium]